MLVAVTDRNVQVFDIRLKTHRRAVSGMQIRVRCAQNESEGFCDAAGTCAAKAEGSARWTIRLLAEHVVERKIVEAAHFNTVGRALKKVILNRTRSTIG